MPRSMILAGALLLAPVAALSGCANEGGDSTTSPTADTTTAVPAGTERLTAQLKSADGTPVANATLDFADGFATVTVETVEAGILTPGFHGMHLHSLGKCEADSVAPTGGPAGDFNSAGGHFQAPGHTGHPASGDLTSLEVRSDGQAQLVTTTDAFTAADLLAGGKTALIIHERPDNFAHIPDRYVQKDGGAAGPDAETLATGDAGPRVACGVIESASSSTTTSSTTTSPTTTTVTTVPPTTTTEAPATSPPTTTTTVTPAPTETSTSTSTATITVPTVPEIPDIPPPPVPPPPG